MKIASRYQVLSLRYDHSSHNNSTFLLEMELCDVITWCCLPINVSGICRSFAGLPHENMIKVVCMPGALHQKVSVLIPSKRYILM